MNILCRAQSFVTDSIESLHAKKLQLMTCEVFKIVNKLSPEYIQDMINIEKFPYYSFRGENKADIPRVNTTRSEVIQAGGSSYLE